MNTKIITALMIFLITLAPMVAADNHEAEDAGTKPGDALYGLDKAMDSLSLAFTFGNEAKAKKELRIAEERLAELKALSEKGEIEKAEEAKKEHEKLLVKVKSRIDKIEKDDSLEQYERELELEAKVREQKERALKIEVKGELTEEQQTRLQELIASLGSNFEELEIKIKTKQEITRVKVEEEHGEDEVEELEGPYWQRKANNEQVRAEEEIVKSEQKISRFENKYFGSLNNEVGESEDRNQRIPRPRNEEIMDAGMNLVTGQVTGEEENLQLDDDRRRSSDDDENEERYNETEDESDDYNETYDDSDDYEENESDDDYNECTVDEDCRSGYYCDSGECEDIEDESNDDDYDEVETEYDDNILDQYGLVIPEYERKNIESSKKYVEDAKEALEMSNEMESSEDFKAAYAYARYAKKLAQKAGSGKYLDLSDAQEEAYDEMKEEKERMEEAEKEERERLEEEEKERDEAEKEERERLEDERKEAERAEKEERERLEDERKEAEDDEEDSDDDRDEEDNSGSN